MAKKNVWEINFAENSKIRDRVKDQLIRSIQERREEREDLEREWLEYFHMWNVDRDAINGYKGRAKLFIPEVRKNVESQARQLTKAAFPNDDFISCFPQPTGTNEGADLHKQVRLHQMRAAKYQQAYYLMMRQQTMLGTSPGRILWRKRKRKIFGSQKKKGKLVKTPQDIQIFNGPVMRPVDLFKWFVLNPLEEDFTEEGCFEDSMISRTELEALSRAGEIHNVSKILDSSGDALTSGALERYIQKVEASGLIIGRGAESGEATRKEDLQPHHKILRTVVHTNLYLPEGIIPEHEDKDDPIPVEIEIFDGQHIGAIRRQREFFQSAPYVCGHYIAPNADEFYGQGLVKAISYMQHELNSKAEQAMDSATLALNPLSFIDPAQAGNMGSFEVEPGAIWWVNPQGVKMAQIPDVTQTGYNAMAQLRAQMADYSDRSPALPAQLMGKTRTATQSEAVTNALSIDTEAFANQNEIKILVPSQEMFSSLTDQNIDDDQILMLTGPNFRKAKKLLVPKNKLLGEYAYAWRGASVGQNKAILTRQLIDFMKVHGSLPPEDKARLNANLAVIARMIFEDGMDLPNAAKVFGTPELESTDPATEFELLKKGFEIEVQVGDDDAEHLKKHDIDLKSDDLDDDQKQELTAHILKHGRQAELKEQQKKMMEMQYMQMQLQLQQQQQQGGRKGNSQGSGNRTQLSPNATAGDQASGVRA